MVHVVTFQMQSSRSKQGVTLPSEISSTSRCHKSLPPSKMDYEAKFFPRIGGFGRYTKKVVMWSWVPNFTLALNFTSSVFLTLVPETYHCQPDPQLLSESKLTWEELIRASVPLDENNNPSRCELLKYPNGSMEASGSSNEWEKVPCTMGWVYTFEVGLHGNFVTEVCQQLFSLAALVKVWRGEETLKWNTIEMVEPLKSIHILILGLQTHEHNAGTTMGFKLTRLH